MSSNCIYLWDVMSAAHRLNCDLSVWLSKCSIQWLLSFIVSILVICWYIYIFSSVMKAFSNVKYVFSDVCNCLLSSCMNVLTFEHSSQWSCSDFVCNFLQSRFNDVESALKQSFFINNLCSFLSLTLMFVLKDYDTDNIIFIIA